MVLSAALTRKLRLRVPRKDYRDTGAALGRCQAPLGEESSAFQSSEMGVRVRGWGRTRRSVEP